MQPPFQQNPYAPPSAPVAPHGAGPLAPMDAAHAGVCPRCQSNNVHKPSFTWWGGALGPKMMSHTVCRACGFGYNGATGLSNRNKIIAYMVVVNAIVLGAIVAWSMAR